MSFLKDTKRIFLERTPGYLISGCTKVNVRNKSADVYDLFPQGPSEGRCRGSRHRLYRIMATVSCQVFATDYFFLFINLQ